MKFKDYVIAPTGERFDICENGIGIGDTIIVEAEDIIDAMYKIEEMLDATFLSQTLDEYGCIHCTEIE